MEAQLPRPGLTFSLSLQNEPRLWALSMLPTAGEPQAEVAAPLARGTMRASGAPGEAIPRVAGPGCSVLGGEGVRGAEATLQPRPRPAGVLPARRKKLIAITYKGKTISAAYPRRTLPGSS